MGIRFPGLPKHRILTALRQKVCFLQRELYTSCPRLFTFQLPLGHRALLFPVRTSGNTCFTGQESRTAQDFPLQESRLSERLAIHQRLVRHCISCRYRMEQQSLPNKQPVREFHHASIILCHQSGYVNVQGCPSLFPRSEQRCRGL